MNGQKLEEVTSFKYLGATLCKDRTCSQDVHIRIASAMAAMVRLNRIWLCNTISFKMKLYKVSCHHHNPAYKNTKANTNLNLKSREGVGLGAKS